MSATTLKTQAIADDAVTTAKIPNNAITTSKIADAQITQAKLASGVGGNTDHSFRLTDGSSQPITDGGEISVLWNTELFDTDNLHSTVTNTDRVTITAGTAGKWLIIGHIMFPGNSNGQRIIRINKNGGQVGSIIQSPPGANNMGMNHSTIIDLAAGDFVTVSAYQSAGVTLSIGNNSQGGPHFDGIRIAT